MRYKAGTARFSRIETDNETYRITTRDDLESLVASIDTSGLINPPILLESNNNTYIIVCGFRRISACRHLGWDRANARFLAPDTPPADCALAAITDNSAQRELNLIETSRAVKLLAGILPDDNAVVAAANQAGLSVSTDFLSKISALCSLPGPWQQKLVDATLSLPMAERLQRMATADAREAFDLFCEIRAGLNVQREILDNAEESARREGIRLKDVLRSDALLRVRGDADCDCSHKTGQIRKMLKERRYPALSAAEEQFARQSGTLGLRQDMKLVPPPGFEGLDYTLTLKFRHRDQLEKQKEVIERLLNGDGLKEILE